MSRAGLHLVAFGALVVCTIGGGLALWAFFGMLGAGVPLAPPYTPAAQRENFLLGASLGAAAGVIAMGLIYAFGWRRTAAGRRW